MSRNFRARITNHVFKKWLGYIPDMEIILLNMVQTNEAKEAMALIQLNSEPGDQFVLEDIKIETLITSLVEKRYNDHIELRLGFVSGFIELSTLILSNIVGDDVVVKRMIESLQSVMPYSYSEDTVVVPKDMLSFALELINEPYKALTSRGDSLTSEEFENFIEQMVFPVEKMVYNVMYRVISGIRSDWIENRAIVEESFM